MQAHLEKLRAETTNCERIAKLATDTAKRDLFTRLAQHYRVLASEVEHAIKNPIKSNEAGQELSRHGQVAWSAQTTSPYE